MAARERRSLPWPALLAGIVFFAASAMLLYESTREYFPRRDLHAFDTQHAELLSAERRAAYERELFSELSQWNRPSRRYPSEAGIGQREKRWRQLAGEGLELAHLALQVLQPDGGFVYPLEKPMNRLLALAERGDSGAMCLMTGLVSQVKRSRLSAEHSEMARKWLIQGAERGHAECQLQLGRRLILGIDGMTKDAKRGLALELAARRDGYAHDVDGLVSYFQQRWSTDSADLTRLYCWLSIHAQSRVTDGPQNMLRLLRAEARRIDSEGLVHLANQLENSRFSLQACVDLSGV
ncbi:hypothetical protein [Variovorax sp. AFSI2.2]|uniref:hypothetical protein n=1 Tax=Variovorax sp. AFSI2.2 TaxID=3384160 RepID=UPI003EC108C9